MSTSILLLHFQSSCYNTHLHLIFSVIHSYLCNGSSTLTPLTTSPLIVYRNDPSFLHARSPPAKRVSTHRLCRRHRIDPVDTRGILYSITTHHTTTGIKLIRYSQTRKRQSSFYWFVKVNNSLSMDETLTLLYEMNYPSSWTTHKKRNIWTEKNVRMVTNGSVK